MISDAFFCYIFHHVEKMFFLNEIDEEDGLNLWYKITSYMTVDTKKLQLESCVKR